MIVRTVEKCKCGADRWLTASGLVCSAQCGVRIKPVDRNDYRGYPLKIGSDPRMIVCPECAGAARFTCDECFGEGEVDCCECGQLTDCDECDGEGSFDCETCAGTGEVEDER